MFSRFGRAKAKKAVKHKIACCDNNNHKIKKYGNAILGMNFLISVE